MAILTKTGRTALAQFIASSELYLSWGRGDPAWETEPPEGTIDQTSLLDVVGCRKAKKIGFCMPDDTGDILVPHGRYALSETPTTHLHCEFSFDFEDGLGETIRELGLVLGVKAKETVPVGQFYLSTNDIEENGTLLLVENRLPLFRDQGVRETFEFVVSF